MARNRFDGPALPRAVASRTVSGMRAWVMVLVSGCAVVAAERPAEACSPNRACALVAAPAERLPSGGSLIVYCWSGGPEDLTPESAVRIEEVDGSTVAFTASPLARNQHELRLEPREPGTVLKVVIQGNEVAELTVGPPEEGPLQVSAQTAAFLMTHEDRFAARYEPCRGEGTRVEVTDVTSSAPIAAWTLSTDLPLGGPRLTDTTSSPAYWQGDVGPEAASAFTLYGSADWECFEVTAIDFAGRRATLPPVCHDAGCGCATTGAAPPGALVLGLLLAALGIRTYAARRARPSTASSTSSSATPGSDEAVVHVHPLGHVCATTVRRPAKSTATTSAHSRSGGP